MKSRIVTVVVVGLLVAGGFYSALRAQVARTVWDGVYTDDQAKRGAVLYRSMNASHSDSMLSIVRP